MHILDESEGYIIYNSKIREENKTVISEDLGETGEIHTQSFLPKFGMLFTPELNNFDVNSPYGISCYANALDEIFSTDKAYDSPDNEITLGKKRIYVKTGALTFKINDKGEQVPIFDPNDVAFYALPRRR